MMMRLGSRALCRDLTAARSQPFSSRSSNITLLYHDNHEGPAPSKMLAFMERIRDCGEGKVELKTSTRDDRVLELTLHNEKQKNALTGRMMMELHDIALELTNVSERHQDKCALILYGSGSTFCAGASFHLAKEIHTSEEGAYMCELMTSTLTRLRRAPLITVSALAGHAMGGGAELSTATDFRIMTENAKIQFVQARMGVSTGWGGAARLVKLLGRQKALQLLGASPSLDAPAALEYGLIDEVSQEKDDPVLGAYSFLHPFLRHTTAALRSIKIGIASADDLSWGDASTLETEAFRRTWGSQANIHALESASARISSSGGSKGRDRKE